jgi:hypothetical protein
MKLGFVCAIAMSTALFGTSAALAESGTVKKTPGHQMQQKGSFKNEPGASGYSPGHEMQRKGSKPAQPGASGFAPGHS